MTHISADSLPGDRIICVDGVAASGKGTTSQRIATQCHYGYFNSGMLYRYVGYTALTNGISHDIPKLLSIIAQTDYSNFDQQIQGLQSILSSEEVGQAASITSAIPEVRAALVVPQQQMVATMLRHYTKVVTDGRDMGTVIFPMSQCKFFLTTNIDIRAQRRFEQLQQKNRAGQQSPNSDTITFNSIYRELLERDTRDTNRAVAPLRAAPDAMVIDTGLLSIDEAVALMIGHINEKLPT